MAEKGEKPSRPSTQHEVVQVARKISTRNRGLSGQTPRSFSQLMEEAEDEGSSFWLNFFSRFAGVSWDEAETIEETQRELANEGAGMRVRMAEPGEKEWFDRGVEEHHELGAGKAVGDYLRQVVEGRGVAGALLTWGPVCYALKDRDLWIG